MPYIGSSPSALLLKTANIADGIITSAKIVDDNVTLAKLAAGTDGNIISFDSSGDPVAIATGSDGQVLSSGGAGAAPAFAAAPSFTYTITAEQATTSGDGITFSGIPSGVTRVNIMMEGVSCGTDGNIYIQLGDDGGLETSGYLAVGGYVLQVSDTGATRSTSSFIWDMTGDAAFYIGGAMEFFLKDVTNNTWVATLGGQHGADATRHAAFGGGAKSLSAVLTQLKIFPENGDFDAGSISLMYA